MSKYRKLDNVVEEVNYNKLIINITELETGTDEAKGKIIVVVSGEQIADQVSIEIDYLDEDIQDDSYVQNMVVEAQAFLLEQLDGYELIHEEPTFKVYQSRSDSWEGPNY